MNQPPHTPTLAGFEPTDIELVRSMGMEAMVNRATALLRKHEPVDGYYLADSFGKDSSVCLKLAQMAGVKFGAHHNLTTIDPPELLRFGKKFL
jgi:3'-phosphoadenosine 5'-phosphosulfate sulfotransferase (PAPS reductase)/FAD synthetase